jgi:dTDP-glucose 4,6-dehydratase
MEGLTMRILVTGGAGFIGSNFIRCALAADRGVAVTNYDLRTYAGKGDNLHDVERDPRYTFVHGDVCDATLLRAAMAGHDAVVNFAAESHVDRSIADGAAAVRTNVLGAHTTFEIAREVGVPRFLHISTDEVYGSVVAPAVSRECDPLRPNSPYAAAKASADLLARAATRTHGYPITIARASNVFGPYQHPEKLIPRFITSLVCGAAVPLYGDGRNVRDWIHVHDVVRGQWLVLTRGQPGAVYHISSGNPLDNLTVTRRILALLGADEDRIRWVPDRPGHDRRYALDASRIRALGWTPRRSFDEALADTVRWYRANAWWWRPLRDDADRPRGRRAPLAGPSPAAAARSPWVEA